jgi:hypothetical protein
LYDINFKLVQYINPDLTLANPPDLTAVELDDAFFTRNLNVPVYNNSSYFAGTVYLPYEAKTVAISATIKIQDQTITKLYQFMDF